jgi:uncharacterized protein (TIGR02246 family)
MARSDLDVGVRGVLDAYRKAVHAGDAGVYAELFLEDAIWAMPGRAPVLGKKAIQTAADAAFSARSSPSLFVIEPELVDIVGDIATLVAHGRPTPDPSRDLTILYVLRRDGERWLISHQIATPRT